MNELQDKLVTCISMFLHIHQNESTNIILFDKGILINSLSYISKEFISENKKDLILFFKKYKIKLTIDKQIKIENNMTPIIMTPMKGGEIPPAPFKPLSKIPQNEKISGKNTFIKIMYKIYLIIY